MKAVESYKQLEYPNYLQRMGYGDILFGLLDDFLLEVVWVLYS